jgi:hypothetical protein
MRHRSSLFRGKKISMKKVFSFQHETKIDLKVGIQWKEGSVQYIYLACNFRSCLRFDLKKFICKK